LLLHHQAQVKHRLPKQYVALKLEIEITNL